jgi:hypothetical protein
LLTLSRLQLCFHLPYRLFTLLPLDHLQHLGISLEFHVGKGFFLRSGFILITLLPLSLFELGFRHLQLLETKLLLPSERVGERIF